MKVLSRNAILTLIGLLALASGSLRANETATLNRLGNGGAAFDAPVALRREHVEREIEFFLKGYSGVPLNDSCRECINESTLSSQMQRVGVFDVGSTGIRLMGADVDMQTGSVKPFCLFEYSLPFGLSDDDSLRRLAAIAAMRNIIESSYCSPNGIEFKAVATAGFRAAGEKGYALAQEIERVTGVEFEIIDQDREGTLAFLGANLEYPHADMSNVVVWDIGGGSMQITMMGEDSSLIMAGCEIAARTFLMETLSRVKGSALVSTPNPLSPQEVETSIALAKDLLLGKFQDSSLKSFDEEQLGLIQTRVQSQEYVLGVGGVHARIVLPSIRAITGKDISAYTPELLFMTIQIMVECQFDDYRIKELLSVSDDSVSSILTSLILVYATLELLDIREVHVLDINNTQGLLAEYVRMI